MALFVDEAHDLHPKTLRGLKRLGEVVRDAGARLAVVLVGHPKLRNDLRRPTMEEIGHRTTIVDFKGIAGQQRPYIDWLLARCLAEGVAVRDVITEEAVELLAQRLGTPLQIERYLTSALEEGWRVGEKPVTAQLVGALLSPQLDESRAAAAPARLRRPRPRRADQRPAGRDPLAAPGRARARTRPGAHRQAHGRRPADLSRDTPGRGRGGTFPQSQGA